MVYGITEQRKLEMANECIVNPKKWYIMDIRDPKKILVGKNEFMFLELAEAAINRHFPGNPLVYPVLGQELIDWNIPTKNSAYRRWGFNILNYQFGEGLTDREMKTLRKRFRRTRRREKYRQVMKLPADSRFRWNLVRYTPGDNEDYLRWRRERDARIRAIYSKLDHL